MIKSVITSTDRFTPGVFERTMLLIPQPNLVRTMKVPKLRFRNARLVTALFATSVAAMVSQVTGQSKDHVDLQFWDMIWGGPEYIDAGKALVAQFNQEHPDITVNYRSVPWTNWYQTFLTAIGSGTAPDLSSGAGYQAVQLYDQNAILPIDDLISAWKAKGKLDDFLPNTVDILKYDNHYVALPWAIDIRSGIIERICCRGRMCSLRRTGPSSKQRRRRLPNRRVTSTAWSLQATRWESIFC
jgi:hypothetical protein